MIFPYASFKVIGKGDNELTRDNLRARTIEEISYDYLLKHFTEKFKKVDQLDVGYYERDSLGVQFGKMIRYFYQKKEGHYFLKINSKKNGYGLIFGTNWQLRDYRYWLGLNGHKAGAQHKPRLLTFSYLCLFNLQTGEVLDYTYFFDPLGVPFDKENICKDELLMENKIMKNLDHVSKHLLRKSKK